MNTVSPTSTPPSLESISHAIGENIVYYIDKLDHIPGGQIIRRYVRLLYKNDPVRSLFELALFLFALHYFLLLKRKENKGELLRLRKHEIDELCNEWLPEPLVEPIEDDEKWQLHLIPEIIGQNGSHVKLKGHQDTEIVNMATSDFLGLNNNPDIIAAACSAISNAGVGACGPPNFYGTQDVHVRLEENLSQFLGTEQSILYGQDFVTAGSVIPAFLKRGDLVICDAGVNLAIQKAVIVLRCNIEWFQNNDVDDLELLLITLEKQLEKEPLRRRFIVTEGLFANLGSLCPLPKIVELKNRFKYRLLLDETNSLGVIGKTGRGVPEFYGISRDEISISIGLFANAFALSGGWCSGVKPMVHHQRINSIAYVFSAALPPYSARVSSQAITEINKLDATGSLKLVKCLNSRAKFAHRLVGKLDKFVVLSNENSPVVHLSLLPEYRQALQLPVFYGNTVTLDTGKQGRFLNAFNTLFNLELFLLQKIVDGVLQHSNVLITRLQIILEQENLPVSAPQLQIMVGASISEQEIETAVAALKTVAARILGEVKSSNDLERLQNELILY